MRICRNATRVPCCIHLFIFHGTFKHFNPFFVSVDRRRRMLASVNRYLGSSNYPKGQRDRWRSRPSSRRWKNKISKFHGRWKRREKLNVYIYIRGYLKVVEKQRFSCIQFILYSLTLRRPSTRSFSTDPLFARNTREKNIVEIVAK